MREWKLRKPLKREGTQEIVSLLFVCSEGGKMDVKQNLKMLDRWHKEAINELKMANISHVRALANMYDDRFEVENAANLIAVWKKIADSIADHASAYEALM